MKILEKQTKMPLILTKVSFTKVDNYDIRLKV
jgi:hypothetical protein